MPYFTSQGQSVPIGKQLAESEGSTVHALIGDDRRVAKIYRKPPLERQGRKIVELVRLATPDLRGVAALPLDTLHQTREGPVAGFLMPRIEGAEPLVDLHSPAHRAVTFPKANWDFLVKVARNCADAVHALHDSGVILGDVNSGRFLVSGDGSVKILGCDEFQIIVGEETYYSGRMVPEYLAPELQAVAVESFPLTPNHDGFGLAVVLFRLLMMGRHPFVAYRGPDRKSVAEAIREFRFAYGATAASLLMEVPPHSLTLGDLPPAVANLFQRAFARGSERPGARPTAVEWIKALDELQRQTVPCANDPGHAYFSNLAGCPWCRIQRDGGPNYFRTVSLETIEEENTTTDAYQILNEFETIAPPERFFAQLKEAPLLPATPAPVSGFTRSFQQVVVALGVLTIGSALLIPLGFLSRNFFFIVPPITFCLLIGWLLAYFGSPLFRIRLARRRTLRQRQAELAKTESEMATALARINSDWMPRFRAAAEVRDRLRAIEGQEANELKALEAVMKQRQLEDYLSRFFLRDLKIQKLSPSRMILLESFGIETAADVTERTLSAVLQLGKTLPTMLLAWRRTAEAGFSFDARRGAPPGEIAKIRNKYQQQRKALEEQLEIHNEFLAKISATARIQAQHFTVPYAAKQSAVVQAKADVEAAK